MEWLTYGWIATRDPKDPLRLGVVQVGVAEVWLAWCTGSSGIRCG
jgi:hypothetical protein